MMGFTPWGLPSGYLRGQSTRSPVRAIGLPMSRRLGSPVVTTPPWSVASPTLMILLCMLFFLSGHGSSERFSLLVVQIGQRDLLANGSGLIGVVGPQPSNLSRIDVQMHVARIGEGLALFHIGLPA